MNGTRYTILQGLNLINVIYVNIVDSFYSLTFIEKTKILLDVGTNTDFSGLVLLIIVRYKSSLGRITQEMYFFVKVCSDRFLIF